MNNKKLTKRASGLCLALMVGLFVLCTTTAGFGQTGIDQNGDCFSIAITTTVGCNGSCEGSNCDNCATFTFTNTSTNCDITSLDIEAIAPSGYTAATCYQICSPQGTPPAAQGCKDKLRSFVGHYPPGGTNGIAQTFTICYSGTGRHYFKITAHGVKWDPNGDECTCMTSAIVHF